MQEQLSLVHIVQWILVVFVAGFIGFFGKHLGQTIITRIQGKTPVAKPPASMTVVESPSSNSSKDAQKATKKRAKLDAKRMKKGHTKAS